jgi:hypothetical protein
MSTAAPWSWEALGADEARAQWQVVSGWVTWLVERYDLAEVVPACWWRHGAITEELTALWVAWVTAYEDPEAERDAPLSWHESFASARARIGEWDRLGCARDGHRDGQALQWHPDTEAFTSFVESEVSRRRDRPKLERVAWSEEAWDEPC